MKCFILSLYSIFILVSCSTSVVTINPIPEQQRIPIEIKSFEDLTGQYKFLHPSLDSLIILTSSLSMIDVIEPDSRLKDERQHLIYQNPIRLLRSPIEGEAHFLISGEVEIISYGPIKDIDERIASYSIFGLLGLVLSQNNDLAAYVQYRIYIKDSKGNQIERFLVTGISSDDPNQKSRKQLMLEANLIAAYSLQSQLIQFFIKQGLNTNSQMIAHLSKQYALDHAVTYMKTLLNTNPVETKE